MNFCDTCTKPLNSYNTIVIEYYNEWKVCPSCFENREALFETCEENFTHKGNKYYLTPSRSFLNKELEKHENQIKKSNALIDEIKKRQKRAMPLEFLKGSYNMPVLLSANYTKQDLLDFAKAEKFIDASLLSKDELIEAILIYQKSGYPYRKV